MTPSRPDPPGYHETPSMILPPAPPPELAAALDASLRRAVAMIAAGRELSFELDGEGELRIEVRDRRGGVVKAVSPTTAVSIMAGLAAA